ncbi:hypothetical protein CAP35_04230 [Chitinophagaceae bacterium IBVUCB1]|nr:hypothetical protein CAP35_04230 [Chitinophagaceae bacterium IBVUCB1]
MRYQVATATYDGAYYVPMYTMLLSLFQNNVSAVFDVHILYNTLTTEQKNILQDLALSYGHNVKWIKMDDDATSGFYTSAYLNVATYYRIFAPHLAVTDADRLLFLDADIIVNGSVEPLFAMDMQDAPLCAVKEVAPYKIDRLGIAPDADYFNAGVVLYNLKNWQANNYHSTLLANIKRMHNRYWLFDQDALNHMFYDKAIYLHPKWNHQNIFYSVSNDYLEQLYKYPAHEVLNNPVIIHYNTQLKPWHYLSTHPLKNVFTSYLQQTPFTLFQQKATLGMIIKKLRNRIKHKIQKIRR